jgi:hypothetical protein
MAASPSGALVAKVAGVVSFGVMAVVVTGVPLDVLRSALWDL